MSMEDETRHNMISVKISSVINFSL